MSNDKKVHLVSDIRKVGPDRTKMLVACGSTEDDPATNSQVENITCAFCRQVAAQGELYTQIDMNAILTRLRSLPHMTDASEASGYVPAPGLRLTYMLEILDHYVDIANRRHRQYEEIHGQWHEMVDQRESMRDFLGISGINGRLSEVEMHVFELDREDGDVRVSTDFSEEDLEIIEEAAALSGMPSEDFTRVATIERAQQVLAAKEN